MDLGKAIKTCRIRRELSQVELAESAGCSVSYLSMLENNKRDPTLSTIVAIADALGVPVEILFFLAADFDQLTGMDKELANALSRTALVVLSTPKEPQVEEL